MIYDIYYKQKELKMDFEDTFAKAYKYLVRVPVGNTEENKEEYIDNILKVFPNNERELIENQWNLYSMKGVLQIMLDVRYGVVLFTMRCHPRTGLTEWQMASEFLKAIPNANDYELPSQEEFDEENIIREALPPTQEKFETLYNVDDLLDKISKFGYDYLSDEEKDFLKK